MIYFEVQIHVDDVYGGSVFYEFDDEDIVNIDDFTVPDAPGYSIQECYFEDWAAIRDEYGWNQYCAYPSYGHSFMVLVGDGGIAGYDDPRAEYVFGDAVEEWEEVE